MKVTIELDDMDDDAIKRASDYIAFVKATRTAMVKDAARTGTVEVYDRMLSELGLNSWICTALSKYNVTTLRQLAAIAQDELRGMEQIGPVALKTIVDFAAKYSVTVRRFT